MLVDKREEALPYICFYTLAKRWIQNIEFKELKCKFKNQMSRDMRNKIKKSDSLLIPADKTMNYYTMNPTSYDKLIKENITKTYKKSNDGVAEKLDAQSASIAKWPKLDNQIE